MDKNNFKNPKDLETSHLLWKTTARRRAYDCAIFSVNEVKREAKDGRCGTFIEIECPKWVVIIPVFTDEEGVRRVIMEQQYRHGSDKVTREFPAGLVEEDEDVLTAARRELMEETGIEAGKIKLIGDVSPNPAFMANRQYYFLAEDLALVSGQNLDDNEEIDVVSLPLKEALFEMGTGLSDNGIMVAAAGFIMQELHKRGELELKK